IITRFPTKGGDTHGHHTASAILAEEAFHKAADPTYHPEQLKYTDVWQARRIVWNKSLFNAKPNEDLSPYMKLDIGGYNTPLRLSYGERAADSRSMHKSQGFGSARSRGPALEYFQNMAGDPAKADVFEGLDLSYARIPGSSRVAELVNKARADL